MAGISTSATLKTNLIAYYDFDEASGTRADSHTNSLDLSSLFGTPTQETGIGGSGNAMGVDDTQNISRPSDDALLSDLGDHSFAFWWKSNATPTGDGTILGKHSSGNGREYLLRVTTTDDKLYYSYYSSNSGSAHTTYEMTNAVGTVTDWNFYVITLDVSNTTTGGTIYLNGSSVSTTTLNSAASGTYNGSERFTVGALRPANNSAGDGVIQYLGIWDKILTASEVTELWNSGNGLQYTDPGGGATPKSQVVIIL